MARALCEKLAIDLLAAECFEQLLLDDGVFKIGVAALVTIAKASVEGEFKILFLFFEGELSVYEPERRSLFSFLLRERKERGMGRPSVGCLSLIWLTR